MANDTPDDFTSSQFRLGMDKAVEESSPTFPDEPSKDQRKISKGIYILLAILLIGLIAAYFDLSRRVNRSQSIGSNQIDSLDYRLNALFDKFTTLEKQANQRVDSGQASLEEIKAQITKIGDMASAANKVLLEKAGKTEMDSVITALKKDMGQSGDRTEEAIKQVNELKTQVEQIGTVKTGLEALKGALRDIETDLKGEINEVTLLLDQSSKTLIELKTKTTQLAKENLGRKGTIELIKTQLQSQQPVSKQVTDTLSRHEKRISFLNKQITDLNKEADIYVKEILKIKKQLKTRQPVVSGKRSQTTPSPGAAASSKPITDSDSLLQQNLKE